MNTEKLQNSWAFASSPRRRARKSSVITACSKQAKDFGIRAGMRYDEAKQLLPELRVLVYKGAHNG